LVFDFFITLIAGHSLLKVSLIICEYTKTNHSFYIKQIKKKMEVFFEKIKKDIKKILDKMSKKQKNFLIIFLIFTFIRKAIINHFFLIFDVTVFNNVCKTTI
jgi:hypothetical protein